MFSCTLLRMYIIIFQIIILFLIRNIYLCPVSNQKTKPAYNPTTLQPFSWKALCDGGFQGCNPCKTKKIVGLQPPTTMTENDEKKQPNNRVICCY